MFAVILLLPLIIAGLVFIAVCAFILGYRKSALCMIIVAVILNLYGESFPMNLYRIIMHSRNLEKGLTISTFNINSPSEDFDKKYEKIASQVVSTKSDIILLNECQSMSETVTNAFDSLMCKSYLYSTFDGTVYQDNVVYSKYPIDSIELIQVGHGKCFPIVSINFEGYIVKLVCCHMNSNNYVDPQTRLSPEEIRTKEDARQYWRTLNRGNQMRREEVDSICHSIRDASKLFILGDMNDVCGSFTLRKLESMELKNAWWRGGLGLGGTRSVLFYPFRIDHILYGSDFKLLEVSLTDHGLSDHKQLTARFKIKSLEKER